MHHAPIETCRARLALVITGPGEGYQTRYYAGRGKVITIPTSSAPPGVARRAPAPDSPPVLAVTASWQWPGFAKAAGMGAMLLLGVYLLLVVLPVMFMVVCVALAVAGLFAGLSLAFCPLQLEELEPPQVAPAAGQEVGREWIG